MDKNYYFVLETNGSEEGPYVLSEIRRRIELGLLSQSVMLCRVGETDYVDPLDMTVETTPVPRLEPDLIDVPTSLDPVSGTMLDAASGVEDLAQTGPFDAIPTMMIEDEPAMREWSAPVVEPMPHGFMPPELQPARRREAPQMAQSSRALEVE